jgi:hypothetical protein
VNANLFEESEPPARKKGAQVVGTIPEWLPLESWREFVDMRRTIRKPLTETAIRLALKKLEKLRDEGYDVVAVIEHSVMCNYPGFYPVLGAKAGAATSKLSKAGQQTADAANRWINEASR